MTSTAQPSSPRPPRRRGAGRRLATVAGLTLLLLGLTAGPALAHIDVEGDAGPGQTALLTFRIPSESPTQDTTKITITLPTDTPLHPPFADGEWIVFWVQDRGMGIPAAYHERIFEKFGQVRGRKVRGTGLGLTFCKLAVEAHHGRIWLESEEGVGSVFAFALPRTHTDER